MDKAYGILLSGDEDDDIINWFIDTAFPKPDVAREIRQRLPWNDVYSREEWAARSRSYWIRNTGIGLKVNTAGNVIFRNTAKTNSTNYNIAANNVFGAIVDRTAPASAAVNGNSAASSAVSTDPWANYSY